MGMDFARKQLEKYGWLEGQGLGKNQDGISKPLKPKLKFDNAGLGHDVCEDYDNPWWQRVYNEAANNIITSEKDNEIVIEVKRDSVDIATRKLKRKLSHKSRKYKGFVKISQLDGAKEKISEGVKRDLEEEANFVQNGNEILDVTSEELFKICGGRTVHQGARHGLKMNAKLARIMEQEKSLMSAADSKNSSDCGNIDTPKLKKKKKKKEREKKVV